MATIYKLKQENGKLSKRNYTYSGARENKKKLKLKGIETKIIAYKEYQVIADTSSDYTGIIKFFRQPNEQEYKQMKRSEKK